MPTPSRILALAALAVALGVPVAVAEQAHTPPQTAPAKYASADTRPASGSASAKMSAAWAETKAMTRREWRAAKKKWAAEKVKWRDCNVQADAEKLAAPKSWSFVASCMTGASVKS